MDERLSKTNTTHSVYRSETPYRTPPAAGDWYWGKLLRRIYAIIYRNIIVWPRDLEALLDSFWWPSFDILIWGYMTVYLSQREGALPMVTAFIISGIFLWMFVYRSQQDVSVLFLKEFWDHNLLNILTSPISIGEYIASTMIIGLVKLVISGVWMAALAYFLFTVNVLSISWNLIPFALILIMTGWWAGFFVMGLVVQFGYRVQSFAWSLIMVIMPFSAVFYPISIMPAWVQAIARVLPTSYVFEGMREVLSKGTLNRQYLLIAFALNILYISVSLLFLSFSFRRARAIGMLVKFS